MMMLAIFIILALLLIMISFPVFGDLVSGAGKWIKDFFNPSIGGSGW